MIIINGVKCETIEEVEVQISGLSEEQKQNIRNDFNKVENTPYTNTVPNLVTRRQIKIALFRSGIPPVNIDGFIQTLSDPMKSEVKIWWEDSQDFYRDNPILNQMAPMLGLTSYQVDQIFILAATL